LFIPLYEVKEANEFDWKVPTAVKDIWHGD
jgi:hypothetical protein